MEAEEDLNSKESFNNYKRNLLSDIFLNIFICVFIVICYFYSSLLFGSISTIYLERNRFSIFFGITLLLLCLLSSLAGKFHGFIAGFIGEFLYQIAFLNTLFLPWCFLIALIGFLCGINKYKPQKFLKIKSILIEGLICLISSIIISIFIVLTVKNYYFKGNSFEYLSFNYGFKFFIESLLSIIIPLPIILFLYDRALAKNEKHIYIILFTHHPLSMKDHTFSLKFGNTFIYFCSRCSGVILGGIFAVFSTDLVGLIYNIEFPPELAVLLCIILPIPGMIDWGTQRLLFRKSTTGSRLLTGFILGNALYFMSLTKQYYFYMIIVLIIYFTIFGLLVYFGHKKEMKQYSIPNI